jgi:hypothetical protein
LSFQGRKFRVSSVNLIHFAFFFLQKFAQLSISQNRKKGKEKKHCEMDPIACHEDKTYHKAHLKQVPNFCWEISLLLDHVDHKRYKVLPKSQQMHKGSHFLYLLGTPCI